MTEMTKKKKKKKLKLLNFSVFVLMLSLTIFFACITILKSYENKLTNEIESVKAEIHYIELQSETIEIPTTPQE